MVSKIGEDVCAAGGGWEVWEIEHASVGGLDAAAIGELDFEWLQCGFLVEARHVT